MLIPDEYDYLIAEMFFSGIRLPTRISIDEQCDFVSLISNLEISKQWKWLDKCQ
jgi:hypothetical protein